MKVWFERGLSFLRGPAGGALRVALALVAVAWMALKLDLRVAIAVLGQLPFWCPVGATAAMFASSAFASVRWALLLEDAGLPRPSWHDAFRTTLEGTSVGLLPTGLAGDLVRAMNVPAPTGRASGIVSVLLVDRLAGLVGLALVASFAVVAKAATTATPSSTVEWCIASLGAGLVVAAIAAQALSLRDTAQSSSPRRLGRRAVSVAALSLGTQGSISVAIATIVHAVHGPASVLEVLGRAPFVILATFVPVTPAGVGQRDLIFAVTYRDLGLTPEGAVAASLAWLGCGLFVATAGIGSLVRRRKANQGLQHRETKP